MLLAKKLRIAADKVIKAQQLATQKAAEKKFQANKELIIKDLEYFDEDMKYCLATCKAAAKLGQKIVQLNNEKCYYISNQDSYYHKNNEFEIIQALQDAGFTVISHYVSPETVYDGPGSHNGYFYLEVKW